MNINYMAHKETGAILERQNSKFHHGYTFKLEKARGTMLFQQSAVASASHPTYHYNYETV